MSATPLLDQVKFPKDLKKFNKKQLKQLAEELRQETISAVSETGGHLGAGLGVLELTVALHHVFNTPEDLLIWDVGHQAYPHKILTGRRDRIRTLRKPGGLSGFTKRLESEYDPFGAAHSSTSISAALGMAVARDLEGKNNEVIAVIGDGSISAGMAYEAMNNAAWLNSRLIVILNDNNMSIAPPTGAMSNYLSRLISSRPYINFRNMARKVLPKKVLKAAKKAEQYAKTLATGATQGNIFEDLGFYYIGPIDGHNLDHLIPILKNIRDDKEFKHPILMHVVTEKGRGFNSPEKSAEKFHAVNKFDLSSLIQHKTTAKAPTYTKVFAESLIKHAEIDKKIVAITAAMPSGTGLDLFAKKFPERCFDVGIAEQHAVTFAAGLATQGYKPFATIYSTFLQRAYDQVVHDVAIQNLPVRFAMDRAGLVGADGPTHAGSFDITYLTTLPNFVVMAASDEVELMHMVATASEINDRPSAVRYPRGEGYGLELPSIGKALPIGKGRIIREGSDVAILSLGTRLNESIKAANELEKMNIRVTVADARFAKPLDEELIIKLATSHKVLITIEEGSIGGFSAHVLDLLAKQDLLSNIKVIPMHLPDYFIEQNTPQAMYEEAGLNATQIIEKATAALSVKEENKLRVKK